MYIYVYTYIHIYKNMYVNISLQIYKYASKNTYNWGSPALPVSVAVRGVLHGAPRIYMYIYIYIQIIVCYRDIYMHIYIHIYTYVYIFMYEHIHSYVYVFICKYKLLRCTCSSSQRRRSRHPAWCAVPPPPPSAPAAFLYPTQITNQRMVQFFIQKNCFAELWSGSEEGSYARLVYIVSLNSRLESNKENEHPTRITSQRMHRLNPVPKQNHQ